MDTVALILAAGRGVRVGGTVPKQFLPLQGRSVLARAIDGFAGMPVFVTIAEGQEDIARSAIGNRAVQFITGGVLRQDSVLKGLEAIGAAKHVLIHDAARCLLPRAVIDRLLNALDDHDGAVPVLPLVDTIARNGKMLGETVDRNSLLRIQTPQAFRFDAIMTSHKSWSGGEVTDDAQLMRSAGFSVATVEGDPMLEKITTADDFAAAEARLATTMISRSASGFDVHRLEIDEELWLGGVQIPYEKGLSGHSDADVALHAITDAVLGCISAGDIGMHFPPSDPQWRGAPSWKFLDHACNLVAAKGGIIDFVDLTLICEAPKIGPYREQIRARIADIVQVPLSRISLKATTTERLGFTGRGEGIAAQAIATVRLPEDIGSR